MTTPAIGTACILAGGLGSRLGESVRDTPKPLLEVAGRPFLDWQLELLAGQDVRRAVLCVGYLGERIEAALGRRCHGIELVYRYDPPQLAGTAGAIRGALDALGEAFLVLYGDTYLRLDYRAAWRTFWDSGRLGLMSVLHNHGRWDASNVVLSEDRRSVAVYDKHHPTGAMQWIDYGLGALHARALHGHPDEDDLARLQHALARDGELTAYVATQRFYEIGTPAALAETDAFLRRRRALRAPPAGAPPSEAAFTAYADSLDVNWSDDLEALHEESSRDHFLDVWTRNALLDSMRAFGPEDPGVILDAGCSSGYLLADLRARLPTATLLGVDLIAAGLRRAHGLVPDAQLLLADVCDLPIDDGAVDVVLSANLLEHVPDDVGALAELRRVLRPGGIAAVIVPAGPGTYDYYDAFLGHERRYARGELAGKAKAFEVLHDTHVGSIIYPAFWAVKKRNRIRHRAPSSEERRALVEADIDRTADSQLGALTTRLERALLGRHVRLPFGIRSLTVLRKPA